MANLCNALKEKRTKCSMIERISGHKPSQRPTLFTSALAKRTWNFSNLKKSIWKPIGTYYTFEANPLGVLSKVLWGISDLIGY